MWHSGVGSRPERRAAVQGGLAAYLLYYLLAPLTFSRRKGRSSFVLTALLTSPSYFFAQERTVEPPSHLGEAIKAHIDSKGLRTYPAYGDLNAQIAEYAGVAPDNCMFTNGSDQGMHLRTPVVTAAT